MSNIKETVKYWDDVAESKNFTTPFNILKYSEYLKKESKILDVGCGYGRTLNELFSYGFKNIEGVDFSEEMIRRGNRLFPELKLMVNNNKALPFEDNSFDSIILIAVLTCIINMKDQKNLVNEIYRVLKPGGIFYINDFLINSDDRNINRYNKFEKKYCSYGVFELPEGAVLRHHSDQWINELLEKFETLEMEKVIYTTMNKNKSNGFYFLGKK